MRREELLRRVKQAIHEVEPGAEVILYGSRVRGEAGYESDWDFLVPGEVDGTSGGRAISSPTAPGPRSASPTARRSATGSGQCWPYAPDCSPGTVDSRPSLRAARSSS